MNRIISFGLFFALFGVASFTVFWHYSGNNSLNNAFATYQFISDNSETSSPSSSDVNNNTSTPTTQSGNATTNGTLLYEFPGIGLKIEYPSNWEKVEYGRAMKAFGEGVIANLLSPLDGSSDKFRDYVLLKVENLSSSGLSKVLANNSIAGGATYQRVFNHPNLANQSDIITTLQEWTSQNGKAFIVEFTAEKDKFAHYLPLANEIINSIEINGIGSSAATPLSPANQSAPLSPANQSAPLSPANQSAPLSPANQSAPLSPATSDNGTISNNETAMTANKTQVSSAIIEKLLKRDIDTNETNADPVSDDTINTEK
jgi:hypothetical protein